VFAQKNDLATELPEFGVTTPSNSQKSGSRGGASQIFQNMSDRGNVRKLKIWELFLRKALIIVVLGAINVQMIKDVHIIER
jgi:hypothetical protein